MTNEIIQEAGTEGGKTVTQDTMTFRTWDEACQAALTLNSKLASRRQRTGLWTPKRTELGAIIVVWRKYD